MYLQTTRSCTATDSKKKPKKTVQYLHDSVLQLTNKKQKALVHYLQDSMLQLTKLLVQYLRGSTSQLHPVKQREAVTDGQLV